MPRLCVVLLLLFGLCYCSETECVDEVKNNHQRSSALALNGFQIHEGVLCSKSEDDWFKIPLHPNSQNGMMLVFNLSLDDKDGTTNNMTSEQHSNVEGIALYNPRPTKSNGYVRVFFRKYPRPLVTEKGEEIYLDDPEIPYPFPDGGIKYTYLLEDATSICEDEGNKAKESALQITEARTLATICANEETDYFLIKGMQLTDVIIANLQYIPAVCKIEFDLLNSEGTVVMPSPDTIISKIIHYNVEQAGDYFLKVYGEGNCNESGGHYFIVVNDDVVKRAKESEEEKKVKAEKKDEL